MTKEKIYNFLLIIFSILFFLFLIEITPRIFFTVIKKEINFLFYGFNKNINISLNSLSKLEIYINDNSDIKLTNNKTLISKSKVDIMVFGGSTSMNYCPGSISWPQYLSKKLNKEISNYARAGKNTDYSIEVLLSETNKKIPETVLWAHKANEYIVAYFGLDRNKDKLFFENINFTSNYKKLLYHIKSFSLSFKKKSLSYFLFDEIILRIQYRYGRVIKYQDFISDQNLIISSYNYKINTIDAINYSLNRGVKNFYIVSLFNEYDLKKNNQNMSLRDETDKRFQIFFNERVKEILTEYKNRNVHYIDTVKLVNNNQIITSYSEKKLFCDSTHQNDNGHSLTSELIYKFIQ